MRGAFAFSVLAGLGLLVLAAIPGRFDQGLFSPGGIILLGIFAWLVIPVWLGVMALERKPRWGLRSAVVAVAVVALVWFDIPQRASLLMSRSSLQDVIDTAATGPIEWPEGGSWVGLVHIEEVRRDGRGGWYFRTRHGLMGLGPDPVSYGFAYQPNGRGTPFGNAYYNQWHLIGDWYGFESSVSW